MRAAPQREYKTLEWPSRTARPAWAGWPATKASLRCCREKAQQSQGRKWRQRWGKDDWSKCCHHCYKSSAPTQPLLLLLNWFEVVVKPTTPMRINPGDPPEFSPLPSSAMPSLLPLLTLLPPQKLLLLNGTWPTAPRLSTRGVWRSLTFRCVTLRYFRLTAAVADKLTAHASHRHDFAGFERFTTTCLTSTVARNTYSYYR